MAKRAKTRKYKITGKRTDPLLYRLNNQGNRLFKKIMVKNLKTSDKKPVGAEFILNQNSHGMLFTNRCNNRFEVCGFVDEETGLFVTNEDGDLGDTAHIKFLRMAAKKLNEAWNQEYMRQQAEDPSYRKEQGYLPKQKVEKDLDEYICNPARFNAELGKQLSHFASRPMPNVNEYLVFKDDDAWHEDIYVTERLPYNNPANRVLTAEEIKLADDFLDVFFDKENKRAFSWYLGACLLNLPVYDERVSRMAVLTSAYGGSGKSSLLSALTNALFDDTFSETMDEFDRFFVKTNRFGTDALPVKRLTVYHEANWGIEQNGECKHNLEGLNVSAIKSMITDGIITKEQKYGNTRTVNSSGFHMVLTNYLPCIDKGDIAMRRRILPILMRPTSMIEKAETLGLYGRGRLESFVEKHAEIFAAYFIKVFRENENRYRSHEYDFDTVNEAATDSQQEIEEKKRAKRQALLSTKASGAKAFFKKAEEETGQDLSLFIEDIQMTLSGNAPKEVEDHIRREGDNLYVDGNRSFLMRYGEADQTVRELLQDFYGPSVRKFHMRAFIIPLDKQQE